MISLKLKIRISNKEKKSKNKTLCKLFLGNSKVLAKPPSFVIKSNPSQLKSMLPFYYLSKMQEIKEFYHTDKMIDFKLSFII